MKNFNLTERIKWDEVRYEAYKVDDAELVLVGFGIVSRILMSVVDIMRGD